MENNITFKYSELRNRDFEVGVTLLIGFFLVPAFELFQSLTDKTILVAVIIGIAIVLKFIIHFLKSKMIIIDSKKIEVRYKFLRNKNCEYRLDDCIGYFCYSTMGIGWNYSKTEREAGILIKFNDGSLFKVKEDYDYRQGISKKLDAVLNLFKNKQIKDFTPEPKTQSKDPYKLIKYPFITDYFLNINIEYKKAKKAFNGPLLSS